VERVDDDAAGRRLPEPLTFQHAGCRRPMILDVVDRPGDPFVAMRRLLTENHEPRKRQLGHIRERSASPARCCRPVSSSASTNPTPTGAATG